MPNRQPPNDPTLEHDLWGEDEPSDRPKLNLTPAPRSDVEASNWDDAGETSNWDDAEDDREYGEISGYDAAMTPHAPEHTAPREPARDSVPTSGSEPEFRRELGREPMNAGDPSRFEATKRDRGQAISQTSRENPDWDDRGAIATDPDRYALDEPIYQPDPVPERPSPSEYRDHPTASSEIADRETEPSYPPDTRSPEIRRNEPVPESATQTPPAITTTSATIAATIDTEAINTKTDAGAIKELAARAQTLRQEVAQLEAQKQVLQTDLTRLVQVSLQDLLARRQSLQGEIESLERRQTRLQEEMRTTFAGASQDLAVRVQGFKEYLVGSLQDLSVAAERLNLTPPAPSRASRPARNPASMLNEPRLDEPRSPRSETPDHSFSSDSQTPLRLDRDSRPSQELRLDRSERSERPQRPEHSDRRPSPLNVGKQSFQEQANFIRASLDRYRDRPDYYGPPWQLRRTFQPIQAERVSDWFFEQGGRGVVRSMGSRLQNILVASTAISILRGLHDKRLRTLVLANSPERLGEWRRGLQDCLGITRNDFGPDRGITLFEDPMLMAQKAERLIQAGWLPLIVMDESEAQLNLSLLQFPLWLAFAADPNRPSFERDWR